MRRKRFIRLAVVFVTSLGFCLAGSRATGAKESNPPYVYVSPSFGLWHWDHASLNNGRFGDHWAPVYGMRAGYSPGGALSVEALLLRGANDVRDGKPGSKSITATSAEVSGLVSFRGLGSQRFYPTVSLGLGYTWRTGRTLVDDVEVTGTDNATLHLGVGARAELSRRIALRFSFRDTFYNRKDRISRKNQDSTIVDTLELSLGIETRFPVGRRQSGGKLR